MDKPKSKIPPQNLDAEQSVLGALMLDKNAIINVADILKPGDFYKPQNERIYQAILELYEKHDPIDILSLTSKLKEKDWLKDVGGSGYLTQLVESVPTSAHIEYYANIVKEKKVLRDLIAASAEIAENAFNSDEDLETMLDTIEQRVFAISQRSLPQKFTSIKEELKSAFERIEKLHRGEGATRGIKTGFVDIDNLLSGFQRSDMIVIGARPSLGKTSLALDMARNIATKEKKVVGIFSLEMSRDQVVDRLISSSAHVPLWELRTGRLKSDEDFALIQDALDELSQAPIFIDDTPSPTILQVRSMARRLQAEHGLDILFIDYLQLLQAKTTSDNVVQQVTEISRGIKAIARELNIPVVALSQLSRAVDQREVKRPKLSDLRESGSIEQDADVVMFIYRKDKDKVSVSPEEANTAEIIIEKHRNGPTGLVRLKFDPEKVSFQSIDKYHNAN